ncbi:MAG: RHS repeat-associated core domain-containing protein [Clostridia bacterium]|nr:RHS repeat-associated core domain-containing protein [Clostridia bacterium]
MAVVKKNKSLKILLYGNGNSSLQEQSRVSYDKDGNPAYMADSVTGFTETFTYNSLGMITQRYLYNSALSEAFCEDFIYDDFGKVINYTCNKIVDGYNELVSQYTYTYLDNAARDLDCVNVTNFANFKLKTDVFGRYTGKEIKNSNNTTIEDCTISYLEVNGTLTNLPASITYTNPNTNQSTTLAYTYDARGNIIEVREDGTLIEQYFYDTLNRLSREINTKLNRDKTYTYDINGNLLNNGNYANDKLTETSSHFGVSYDQMGNITYLSGEELFWSKNKFAGTYNSYYDIHYDGLGRRHDKTHNRSGDAIKFIYDSQNRLLQSTNGLTFIYDFTGVAGFKYNGNNYYYRKDILGNVIALLDGNGTLVATYVYDAWGITRVLDNNGNVITDQTHIGQINPFRYRGYFYDKETGFYFCESRYYSPNLCRWISPDSKDYLKPDSINGLNLYTYCGNNPIMYTDPSGNFAISTLIIGAIVGIVIGAVSSTISQGLNKGWDNINGWQVLLDATIGGISGALGASGVGLATSAIVGGILGAAGSVGGDLIASGGNWNEVNVGKAICMGVIGAALGAWTGAGTQNTKVMINTINAGKSWGSKAFLTSAKEASLRPNSGLTLQTMYINMSKAIRKYTIQGISKVSLSIFGSTMFGNI